MDIRRHRFDHIENTVVREKMAIAPITDKIAEGRTKLFGHIKRSNPESVAHERKAARHNNLRYCQYYSVILAVIYGIVNWRKKNISICSPRCRLVRQQVFSLNFRLWSLVILLFLLKILFTLTGTTKFELAYDKFTVSVNVVSISIIIIIQ